MSTAPGMFLRHRVSTGASIYCFVLLLAIVVSGCGGASYSGVPAAAPESSTATPSPAQGPPSELKKNTLLALQERNITAVPLDSQQVQPPVDRTEASRRASAEFGFTGRLSPSEVSLAKTTVRNYGTLKSEQFEGPQSVDLKIKDQNVWLVVFDGIRMVPHAPKPDGDGAASIIEPSLKRMVVLIDAASGDFLRASSFGSSSSVNSPPAAKKGLS